MRIIRSIPRYVRETLTDTERKRRRARRIGWIILRRLPKKDVTVNTLHGRLTFPNVNHPISEALYLERHFEQEVIDKALAILNREGHLLNKDGYVLDIGANIGTVCVTMALRGITKHALAFEPDPGNFSYLMRNIQQNNLAGHVRAFQYALSSHEGKLQLEISSENYGDHRIRVPGTPSSKTIVDGHTSSTVEVSVYTLDRVLHSVSIPPQDISLMWMDVQGHEGHVLQGATSLLEIGTPIVLEFWLYGLKRAGINAGQLSDMLSNYYTHVFDLDEDVPQKRPLTYLTSLYPDARIEDFTNILLLKD